jgi:hypothetical protein
MEQETYQTIEVEVPRSQLIILRKLFNGAAVKDAIQKCVETFTAGWQAGIELTTEGITAISNLLNVRSFNSEASLIEAIQKRFNMGPMTAIIELDGNLAAAIKRVAAGNNITVNACLRNYVQAAFASGYFNQRMNLQSLFFSPKEWETLKKALGEVPSTGGNVASIVAEWKALKALPVPPVQGCIGEPEAVPDPDAVDPLGDIPRF